MKILFATAIRNKPIQKGYYPLAFGYLKAYANKFGENFSCAYTEKLDNSILQREKPAVVALTCSTENYPVAAKHAATTKRFNPKIKVVLGGVHVSNAPDSLTKDFDLGVLGEGEQTFLELVQNDFVPNAKINGIVYTGTVTEQRQLIEPLDLIPHPDRSIYGKARLPYIFTARGCPWRCKFCSSSRFWRKVRLHSASYVSEEINLLATQGVKHIQIYDDTFLIDVNRLREIMELTKGLGLTFGCAARANQITDSSIELLKRFGVVNMGVGFESNSAKVLAWMDKGNTPEINQIAVDVLKRWNMPFSGSFIVDTPVETKADVEETKRFIRRNKIPYHMNGLMGFPGTPIYDGSTDWGRMRCRDYLPFHIRCKQRLAEIKPVRDVYKAIVRGLR